MSNLLSLAGQLRLLNETLERGERLDQLVVLISPDADETAISAAIAAEAASRSVLLDQVEQIVVVKRYESAAAAVADAEEVR